MSEMIICPLIAQIKFTQSQISPSVDGSSKIKKLNASTIIKHFLTDDIQFAFPMTEFAINQQKLVVRNRLLFGTISLLKHKTNIQY